MKRHSGKAFTIVEMLVVISIIALLAGILLPAISRARSQAALTKSQSNLRNIGTAHANYASEWNDRQLTFALDNITSFGSDAASASLAYAMSRAPGGTSPAPADYPPPVVLGWYGGVNVDGEPLPRRLSAFFFQPGAASDYLGMDPIIFSGDYAGFGNFRMPNVRAFNQYLGGRFYDPIFYAPKDIMVLDVVSPLFDDPNEYVPTVHAGGGYNAPQKVAFSSYCMSPASMFSPEVFATPEKGGFKDPWSFGAGLRTPSMGQVRYSDLKTHMLEHHWLQQSRSDCNPAFTEGRYNNCEPYYFNHGFESTPVTLFYDGHVAGVGARQAAADDARMRAQTQNPDWGLWSHDTPLGGPPDGGYFMDVAYDFTTTSFHILTTEGARGRDILSN